MGVELTAHHHFLAIGVGRGNEFVAIEEVGIDRGVLGRGHRGGDAIEGTFEHVGEIAHIPAIGVSPGFVE